MRAEKLVIVGGGVIGSSIAWHLKKKGFQGPITVFERDPSYQRASSSLAMGGVRQQFSNIANIRLAQHSVRFYEQFSTRLRISHRYPKACFQQRGYLFLADDTNVDHLHRRFEHQLRLGANIKRLEVADIKSLVPDIAVDNIRFGIFGPDDGYVAPRDILFGFRKAAIASGVTYTTAEVTDLVVTNGSIQGVVLDGNTTYDAKIAINAAGPFAANLASLAGIELPVMPVRQQLFRCRLPARWPYRFPLVVDPSGVHWRHEDPVMRNDPDQIIVARTNFNEPPGENFDCDMSRWKTEFRPPLVSRVPAFDSISVITGWAGLYEMTPDHNPLLGEHTDLRGFYLANGFSGHGLMMAPATGAAIAELITTGTSSCLDITAFSPDRFNRNDDWVDDAMI